MGLFEIHYAHVSLSEDVIGCMCCKDIIDYFEI